MITVKILILYVIFLTTLESLFYYIDRFFPVLTIQAIDSKNRILTIYSIEKSMIFLHIHLIMYKS